MSKKMRIALGSTPLTQSPFSGLSALARAKPGALSGPSPANEVAPSRTSGKLDKAAALAGRIVVRRETAGRSGKTVTVIQGLKLDAPELEQIGRDLRASFGCGGSVEDGNVILSGDQRVRAEAWLLAQGAKKVVLGN